MHSSAGPERRRARCEQPALIEQVPWLRTEPQRRAIGPRAYSCPRKHRSNRLAPAYGARSAKRGRARSPSRLVLTEDKLRINHGFTHHCLPWRKTEARVPLVASAPVEDLSFDAKHLPDRATSHGTRIDRPRGPATYGCNEQMFGAK